MNVDERMEAAVAAVGEAVAAGGEPDLSSFLAAVPGPDRAELYGCLAARLVLARAGRGDRRWIECLLGAAETRLYRADVCRALGDLLYGGADAAVASDLDLLTFGRYAATGLMGFGGFGTVLRAEDPRDPGRVVAVKVAHAGVGPAEVLLENEARALQAAARAGVRGVPAPEGGVRMTAHGRKYLVMEFVEGETLEELLGGAGGLDRGFQLGVCRQLVKIVNELHPLKLVHGDLTPANVLVGGTPASPRVRLVDFGNCNHTLQPHPMRAQTHRYAAPELLLRTVQETSAATDGWSLGLVLYEVLGTYPFLDAPPDATDARLGRHFLGGRKASLPGHWPPELVQQVNYCLTPEWKDREVNMNLGMLQNSIPSLPAYHEWLRAQNPGPRRIKRPPEPAPPPPPRDASPGTARPHDPPPAGPAKRRVPHAGPLVFGFAVLLAALAVAAFRGRTPAAGDDGGRDPGAEKAVALAGDAGKAKEKDQKKGPPPSTRPDAGGEEEALAEADRMSKALSQTADGEPTEAFIEKLGRLVAFIKQHENLKDSPHAADWLERHCHTLNWLGLNYREAGKSKGATDQWKEVLRLCPKPSHWRGIALLELGNQSVLDVESVSGAAAAKGLKDRAADYFRQAEAVFADPAVAEKENASAAAKKAKAVHASDP